MIKYYLGEKPALAQVPTWICAERAQRDYVLDNIAELVVKPIDGHGGAGVVIGPEASADALEVRRRELQSQPERYIAQEAIALSTHPTFDERECIRTTSTCVRSAPRPGRTIRWQHTLCRPADPGGSTRIPHVNSSSGGGSKDT
jgi:carboxylate-amine ligase